MRSNWIRMSRCRAVKQKRPSQMTAGLCHFATITSLLLVHLVAKFIVSLGNLADLHFEGLEFGSLCIQLAFQHQDLRQQRLTFGVDLLDVSLYPIRRSFDFV